MASAFSPLPLPSSLLSLLSLFWLLLPLSSSEQAPARAVSLENPILHVVPSGVGKDGTCERVRLVGLSRTHLKSFANFFHVSVKASDGMPDRHRSKTEFCFHRNASAGLCQCEEWRKLQKGKLDAVMSPYENKYIDIKFVDGISGFLNISIEEETQHWRFVCLGIGFVLLLLAPIVSEWAPFYYSSSMVLGILLVVLVLLFQGMKLLPTGRKNFFYLSLYGSLIGAGSFLVHHFSMLINSLLLIFGLSDDVHSPVSILLLSGVVFVGAAFGYWTVRKFVLLKDGNVDAGIAQFVKWAMRVIAMVFILQSSLDYLLALAATLVCWKISSLIWRRSTLIQAKVEKEDVWQRRARQAAATHRQAEFLSRPGKKNLKQTCWGSLSSHAWSSSPSKGLVVSSPRRKPVQQQDYYSTFHKIPVRKYTKKEWDDFTREWTRNALSDWASSPEVCEWLAENAHRIHLEHKESSDDSMDSSSNSSEETIVGSDSAPSFFRWL